MIKNSQNGNAIVMILIAVALFAALGFAFSNTSRTSTKFITDEEAKAYANQVIAYGNEVKSAVKRLQLRGCKDTEISFEATDWDTNQASYTNPNAPSNKTCHIFDMNGGQIKWQHFPMAATHTNKSYSSYPKDEYQFRGNNRIQGLGTYSNGADSVELAMYNLSISDEACIQINKKFSVSGIPDNAGVFSPNFGWLGTYVNSGVIRGSVVGSTYELDGKKVGCFLSQTAGEYNVFYYALIDR